MQAIFGHAIEAAEITPVGDRKPYVINFSSVIIF